MQAPASKARTSRTRRTAYRPELLPLEVRVPLGDTLLGPVLALAWLGQSQPATPGALPGVPATRSVAALVRVGATNAAWAGPLALEEELFAGGVSLMPAPHWRPAPLTEGMALEEWDTPFNARQPLPRLLDALAGEPRSGLTAPGNGGGPVLGSGAFSSQPSPLPGLTAADALFQAVAALPPATVPEAATPSATEKAEVQEKFGQLPLQFEANHGQTDASVHFLSRGPGYTLFLTATEAVMVLSQPTPTDTLTGRAGGVSPPVPPSADDSILDRGADAPRSPEKPPAVVRMQIVGGNSAPAVRGDEQLPGIVNYFLGNDPAKWRTNVPTFARVAYDDVYPGIDLVYYGNPNQLEYDFVVSPGADPNVIRLGFAGAERVEIDAAGDLVVHAGGQQLRQHRPVVYQEVAGAHREIASQFALDGHEVCFQVAAYDRGRPLVIDPILSYSTYLGGSGREELGGGDIAVDPVTGDALVTGTTTSTNFPTANPLQPSLRGGADAYVARLRADGQALVYSTYLGGSFGGEAGYGIAVDSRTGSAIVTGWTTSFDFPTANAIQPTMRGFSDAFITRLRPDGAALVFSTYLGGTGRETGYAVGADSSTGDAFVTGSTNSNDFPTVNALQPARAGGDDAFVTRLRPNGTIVFSTFLGGNSSENQYEHSGIAVNSVTGDVLITGRTNSTNFPTVNPLQPTPGGYSDAYVARLRADGSALVYSTYLGGSNDEYPEDIAVDPVTGDALVTGGTSSIDFPIANPLQAARRGNADAYVARLRADGQALVYSTYLGGSGNEGATGIAVDPATGDALVTGETYSSDFPETHHFGPPGGGAFVTKINATGSAVVYSAILAGGFGRDIATGPATGEAVVMGSTTSTSFPTVRPLQPTLGGSRDVFVAKVDDRPLLAVNVVTHGFNPSLATLMTPFDPGSSAWTSFLQPWNNLRATLNQVPRPQAPLAGRVQTHVGIWDSSRGWIQAFVALGTSLAYLPGHPAASLAALLRARDWMQVADRQAQTSADRIVDELTRPGGLLAQNQGQVIHLIGHSRGGAVNARVSRLLTNLGYTVDQYTALDGYSTDWPNLGSILGDISITAEARGRRKVNYRVEASLDAILPNLLQTLIGRPLTPYELPILLAGFADWRAPNRSGFENIVLRGVTDSSPCQDRPALSNHTNITTLYTQSACRSNPAERYIWDNYVGQNRGGGTGPRPDPPVVSEIDDASGFGDGSMEKLGRLWQELSQTQFPEIDSNLARFFVTDLVRNPMHIISTRWTVTGSASIVQTPNDTEIELTQTAETSLGQPLILRPAPVRLWFDLDARSAGINDRLELVFNNQVLRTWVLRDHLGQNRFTVPLTGLGGQAGDMTFRLTGPTADPAVVRLDNVGMSYL